jgi:hypothetical protein
MQQASNARVEKRRLRHGALPLLRPIATSPSLRNQEGEETIRIVVHRPEAAHGIQI